MNIRLQTVGILLGLLFFTSSSFAQFTFREYTSHVNYEKDTMHVAVSSNTVYTSYIYVNNTSGAAKTGLKIEREKITDITGSGDYFCWGITCYSEGAISPNNPWTTPTPVDLNPSDSAALTMDFDPHGNSGSAHFRFRLLSSNGKAIDSMDVIYTSTAGIETNVIAENLSVYPNPASENLFVKLPTIKNSSIKIMDMLGNVVYSSLIQSETTKVDATSLREGIYFVSIYNENKAITTKKIVIKR